MTYKLIHCWLPYQTPGVIRSVLELVGRVSVYYDWVRYIFDLHFLSQCSRRVCMHACMYACTYLCVHVRMSVHLSICMYVCMYACMYELTCACMSVGR